MSPTELHDLYAPLWEKVPETRPVNPQGTPIAAVLTLAVNGWWAWELPNTNFAKNVGIVEGAALCRVAVEDWLDEHSRSTLTMPGKSREGGYFIANADEDDPQTFVSGPTVHHALVAAALAVADLAPSPARE